MILIATLIVLFVAAFVVKMHPSFLYGSTFYSQPLLSSIAVFMVVLGGIIVISIPIRNYLVDKNKEEIETYANNLTKLYLAKSDWGLLSLVFLLSILVLVFEGVFGNDLRIDLGAVSYSLDKVLLFLFALVTMTTLSTNSHLYNSWFKGFRDKRKKK